jgi:hypothetical protein
MKQSPQGRNGDPRGIEMESDTMMNENPYRLSLEMKKVLIMSVVRR